MNLAIGFNGDEIEQYYCYGYDKVECEEAMPNAMRIIIASPQHVNYYDGESRPEILADWRTRKYYESVGNEWEVNQYKQGKK